MKNIDIGRHVFGLAAIWFGVISLLWRSASVWPQIRVAGNVSHPEIVVCIIGAIQIFGGFAIQWPRTARAGSVALGAIYLILALLWVPRIVAQPLIYDRWGNFFEQFSQFAGALIVYATVGRDASAPDKRMARLGYIFFGVCVISFTLEQLFYLQATAGFVPKWIPPGQMFWAIATTIAFALAALALLSGRTTLLAAQLLTVMLIGFGLLLWLPTLFADPHKLFYWTENAENLSIAGAAWIVADFLRKSRSESRIVTNQPEIGVRVS